MLNRDEALRTADDLARAWSATAASNDEAGAFPTDDMERLRDTGLLGLLVPERLGGMGGRFPDYVQVAMRLARGSGANALLFNMHASVTGALAGVPDEVARELGVADSFFERRDELLRGAAKGSMYGVAISESGAGSRLSAIQTTYRRVPDGYRLGGRKSTCSGAGHLDAYLVAARDGDAPADHAPAVSYFLVPGGSIGDVDDRWDPLGMRATASNGFELDVVVDEGALVGVEGVALLLAYSMPEWLVASYAAVYAGLAGAAVEAAVQHVSAAEVLEPASTGPAQPVPLSSSPWVRQRLGRADASADAARLAVEAAAAEVDARPGETSTTQAIYRAKLVAGDAAFTVAADLVEACGLGSLTRGSPLERILRDARSGALMPPSSDIAANVLGALALGTDLGSRLGGRPW